jgi:hypothetical protein
VVVIKDEIYNFVDLRHRLVVEGQAQSTGRYSRPNKARTPSSGQSLHTIKCFEIREKGHLLASVPSFISGPPTPQSTPGLTLSGTDRELMVD